MLLALLVLGGDSLADCAFALVLGIVAGTSSTGSVAVRLTVTLDRRWPPPPPVSSTRGSARAHPEGGAVVQGIGLDGTP